jgi:adenylate kinase
MVQLIFLGAPGSGKGTQASRLVKEQGYRHISTGDLLRAEIAKGSSLGKKVEGILKEGKLVDDAVVLELLKANCTIEKNSYIFDGFPRNLEQAKALEANVLKKINAKAIYFEIDTDVVVERIVNRRVAKKSGEIYNLLTRPPRVPGKCDVSGEDLIHRDDDREETVRKRMDIFIAEIQPMLDYYKAKDCLYRLNADQSSAEVYEQIVSLIKK